MAQEIQAQLVMANPSTHLVFWVNGKKVDDPNVNPELTLLSYLRRNLRLTGSKLACGEGGCGACTVMVSHYDVENNCIVHRSVNGCLAPICSVDGMAVTTVEGIGSIKERVHPIQQRLAECFGSQCGFCTPGIVMSMYVLLRNNPKPTTAEIEANFDGNLCRCTGYRPILTAFKGFASDKQCGDTGCCGNTTAGGCCRSGDGEAKGGCCQGADPCEEPCEGADLYTPEHASQEPIFPPELLILSKQAPVSKEFTSHRVKWFRPATLSELLELKAQYPDAKLVAGNTELGVEVYVKKANYTMYISTTAVAELRGVSLADGVLKIAGNCTLAQLKTFSQQQFDQDPQNPEKSTYLAILEALKWFASNQIRNVSSVAGNVVTGSPISDLCPVFLTNNASLSLASKERGERVVSVRDFFTGYRKNLLEADEVLTAISVPLCKSTQFTTFYKQSRRRDDDIALANASFRVQLADGKVDCFEASFGGVAITPLYLPGANDLAKGKAWDKPTIESINAFIQEQIKLTDATPGGMPKYRLSLLLGFLFKFFAESTQRLGSKDGAASVVDDGALSAITPREHAVTKSVQTYDSLAPAGPDTVGSVGMSLPHTSGLKQCTGEAQYFDDIPAIHGELHAAYVCSRFAHAKVLSIDASKALEVEGVCDFVSAKDIPGTNSFGFHPTHVEELMVTDEAHFMGQVIGVIVAETPEIASRAATLVNIEYQELPAILTIQDAIKAKAYYNDPMQCVQGDVDAALAECDYIHEGQVNMGGQEQFYFETHGCLVIPNHEDELEIISSNQDLTLLQRSAAKCLGLPASHITVKAKRLGGGFGGKETRASVIAIPAVVAAYKHSRPVRLVIPRQLDMQMSGGRNPFYAKYKIGYTKEGIVKAVDVDLYLNGGYSADLSIAVMSRAVLHIDNSYWFENLRVRGFSCSTNRAPNTAFRGFGAPQSMFVIESAMTEVAAKLNMAPEVFRSLNFYKNDQKTHYDQVIEDCQMDKVWETILSSGDFAARRAAVDEFNAKNRYKKRGLAVTPVKFACAFGQMYMNQGSALVHIQTDGSVLVTHGGVEMGQGLHTKMIQVAATALNVPVGTVHISKTSTDTTPNEFPTAGSMSSDRFGLAILNACKQLNTNLAPLREKFPDLDMAGLAQKAIFEMIPLSAYGHDVIENLYFDHDKMKGRPFSYMTWGAAAVDAEIDVLTGDCVLHRADILMDVGKPLNPRIDIGQVEGAFMQGVGLFTLEEKTILSNGFDLTCGPGNYKIPSFNDIPVDMRCHLLRDSHNPRALHSSKAVGEPPLFLGCAAYFAARDAVAAARKEFGASPEFQFDSPATCERIRLACEDDVLKKVTADTSAPKSWATSSV
eukprot:m.357132 g.357132  ORF g.357132 m.357132 type:complete len:1353 (+) comp17719_c0_seq1:77-4135(+)